MKKKNLVTLKPKERKYLKELIAKGIKKARTLRRCRILLRNIQSCFVVVL